MAATGTPGRTDRIPPYSEEAERGVLGSLMLDTERVLDMCRVGQLGPQSFYVPAHQILFETFSQMADEGRPVDLLSVGEYLKTAGLLERIGGHQFLTPCGFHADSGTRRLLHPARPRERPATHNDPPGAEDHRGLLCP